MSAAVLKKPDQATMLQQLADAAGLESAGAEARAVHDCLKASIWTAEDRERGRQKGRDGQRFRAQELRVIWWRVGIQAIIDNIDAGNFLRRGGIIENIRAHSFAYGLRGKGGGNIQFGTISKWLTVEREGAMYLEAIGKIEERARKVLLQVESVG
jgi:hypothetical protein